MRVESVAKSIKMLKGVLDGKTYVAVAQESGLSRSAVEQRVKALEQKTKKLAKELRDLQHEVKTHDQPHTHPHTH